MKPKKEVTLNHEQQLYVIPEGPGYSCLGFDVLETRYKALASECTSRGVYVHKAKKARGTLERYAQYEQLVDRARFHSQSTGYRFTCSLIQQLINLEGKRVELTYPSGEKSRFYVGKSTGWMPCHLEIKTSRSTGGGAVYFPEGTKIKVITQNARTRKTAS